MFDRVKKGLNRPPLAYISSHKILLYF